MESSSLFLDDIVLQQCGKNPQKIAVTFENQTIRYSELGNKIHALAQQLVAAGVKNGDFVAVLLPPCAEISIAILAITRIGAIYAPLDPDQENSALQGYFQSTRMRCIVTTQALQPRFSNWTPHTIAIDRLPAATDALFHPEKRSLQQPTCIFFTSGTTGTAKGVLGSALALRNAITDPAAALQFSEHDVLNSIARYAWSISMLEILVPLVTGGQSLVLDRKKALDLPWLQQQVQQCTAFHCPPALLRSFAYFLDSPEKSSALNESHLRLVWYGGDVFSPDNIALLHKVFPSALIGTAYGCTEIFGLSHVHLYDRAQANTPVLIGKPIAGMDQKLVNEKGEECRAGETAEIWLSGPRLATEYRGNSELTAEKFVTEGEQRYFKTGDYALLHQSGSLEFLTRKDSQVKIRGIRIELSEIEYFINKQKGVRESLVLAKETATGDKQLRAIVVSSTQEAVQERELISALQTELPDYKIPNHWFFLEKWPVTENFKIDRKALLALEPETAHSKLPEHIQPLADIWNQVNGKAPGSVDDNYFNSGGSSLLAMQLAVKISKAFHTKFDVVDVYKNPTLNAQADLLKLALAKESHEQNPNSEESTKQQIPATRSQIGLFFRELLYNKGQSITCTRYIHSRSGFNVEHVRQALLHLINHHSTLRTNLIVRKPNALLQTGQYQADDISVLYADGEWQLDNGKDALVKQPHKFNLKRGPLIAAIISRLKSGGEVLQLTVHHIAADDNAMNRLAAEFLSLYDACPHCDQVELQVPAVDFNRYAQQQFEQLEAGNFAVPAQSLANQLEILYSEIKQQPLLETENLKQPHSLAKELPATIANMDTAQLIAVLSWNFAMRVERRTFVFCAHSATKQDMPESSVVGMFVNLVPIVISVDTNRSFTEHLDACRNSFRSAMARSDLPYEMLFDSNETLKKARKFPFDAYVNELIFTERYFGDYENLYVPRNFATDQDSLCLTYLQINGEPRLQLDTPWSDAVSESITDLFNDICDSVQAL